MFLWQSTSTLGSLAALLRQFDRLVDGAPAKGPGPAGERDARAPGAGPADRQGHRRATT
ncbi:hypothetical protein L2U69_17640 [Zavarzinia compransoris]|uniref:hypothetical protein n=1 Tax=Zavarzinia marina TaxID=2911065 RepID=UPI001F32238F|nr:hypothetical protein [Zavarzinia marina]MCF4167475.1 hypothetical protein [Zavarzinia marina]